MTPVQVDWLSLVFGPVGIILILAAFFTARSAGRRGDRVPGWAKAAQAMGMVLVLCMALANMAWGS
ncbi:hypothetical protein O7599_19040 [Streptomyces sp. WMMC500]|uniref:hypothetical protein n=1 Tax=Streptomyces sp. WMMC500 TaxID=3015154 RepID=UPI00248CF306|nr:hypothetical protein [Streptomyces sp. WMMC500]WBB57782.1 hypothetical protein O7599_19040 [Streptomyces sp. WMMC500]